MSDQDTGESREVTINYFDGTSRVATVVDREVPYPDGKLIVSRTDPKGIITHANQAFVDMSGYTRDELIGVNHYILRHPDMPAVAFAGLWETIEAGKKWHGYVKNLRKDGSYYWVKATVIPNIRNGKLVGYTSVRRKPSRSKIKESEELYATLM
ncbi:PAS domain-containing protein [Pontibacterium sp.]|uniref:PAS domain-containing protein n=1 Tax=Pontibacterium sp. TaxID=2036026 RepID=UPI003519D224